MDAALGLPRADPASAARVVARLDPAGAGRAADRRVAVIHQGVDENALLGDVVVDLLLRPADDGIDLDHLAPGVPLDGARVAPLDGLVPADPGTPCVGVASSGLQRLELWAET